MKERGKKLKLHREIVLKLHEENMQYFHGGQGNQLLWRTEWESAAPGTLHPFYLEPQIDPKQSVIKPHGWQITGQNYGFNETLLL